MSTWTTRKSLSPIIAVSIFLMCSVGALSTAWSQSNAGPLSLVSNIETGDLFSEDFFAGENPDLSGLAFPPGAHTLLVPATSSGGSASVILVAPPANGKGHISKREFVISDSINVAFDSTAPGSEGQGIFRLFLLDEANAQLLAFKSNARNVIDPSSLARNQAQQFGVTDPQGMTLDATANGRLFILDPASRGIMRIDAAPGRGFDGAQALVAGRISQIALPAGLSDLRGIAFNPANGNLLIFSPAQGQLHEITVTGEFVRSMRLPGFQPQDVQGLIVAPSLDSTDAASVFHLYVAASGGPNRGTTEWKLPGG